jgi:hypothetical protein
MSLLQWFSRQPRRERGSETRRSQRSLRREQLYGVVRDAMVRAGILSAGYKFKILALDAAGHRFVIMVDLAPAYAAEATRLQEVEGLISELARARLQVAVPAVYWRVGEAGAAGQGSARPAPRQERRALQAAPARTGDEGRDFAASGLGLLGGTQYGELR